MVAVRLICSNRHATGNGHRAARTATPDAGGRADGGARPDDRVRGWADSRRAASVTACAPPESAQVTVPSVGEIGEGTHGGVEAGSRTPPGGGARLAGVAGGG
jgi:hypothetical protein